MEHLTHEKLFLFLIKSSSDDLYSDLVDGDLCDRLSRLLEQENQVGNAGIYMI